MLGQNRWRCLVTGSDLAGGARQATGLSKSKYVRQPRKMRTRESGLDPLYGLRKDGSEFRLEGNQLEPAAYGKKAPPLLVSSTIPRRDAAEKKGGWREFRYDNRKRRSVCKIVGRKTYGSSTRGRSGRTDLGWPIPAWRRWLGYESER